MNKAINKTLKSTIGIILSMIIVLGSMLVTDMKAFAAETVTVTGTIKDGSTYDLIKLDSDGSEMKIKIDSNTDLTDCKVLLAGTKINASVYVGNDKYLHASKISLASNVSNSTVNNSSSVIISGNIKSGTTNNKIKLSTILGDFDIKFDNGTDVSGCAIIAVGKNVIVTCQKDSAGALYATKIADGTNVATTTSSNPTGTTTTVTGKVASNSNANVLYLANNSGTMTIKIDSDTDTSKGVVLATDSNLTVTVYTGSDSYLHAQKIVQTRTANSYSADTNKLYKITGKVAAGSTPDMIKFDMGDGSVMNLKLDDTTTVANGLILTKDAKIVVTCGRGADAYMHAAKIDKAN